MSDLITSIFEANSHQLTGHDAGCTFGGFSMHNCYWLHVDECPEDHEFSQCFCGDEVETVIPFGSFMTTYMYAAVCSAHLEQFEADLTHVVKEVNQLIAGCSSEPKPKPFGSVFLHVGSITSK